MMKITGLIFLSGRTCTIGGWLNTFLPHCTTHHCDLYALMGWPSIHICRQTHWFQVIYKSMLGKAPPYISSPDMITPTHSTRSSRYISLVIPKANTSFGHLSFQFSAANDWNKLLKIKNKITEDTFLSLTLTISYLSSKPFAAAVHSPSVNSPPNLPTSYFIYFYTLLHNSISTCTSSAHPSLQC
jgi:hypothetical protein